MSHMVFITASQHGHCNAKSNRRQCVNAWGVCVPIKLYVQKQEGGQDLALGPVAGEPCYSPPQRKSRSPGIAHLRQGCLSSHLPQFREENDFSSSLLLKVWHVDHHRTLNAYKKCSISAPPQPCHWNLYFNKTLM